MGNCCSGSPTSDHPFTPDELSLPTPQTAFTNASPPLNTARPEANMSFVLGGTDEPDSVAGRSPDALIHMADREG